MGWLAAIFAMIRRPVKGRPASVRWVNRMAILVRPKEPYLAGARSLEPPGQSPIDIRAPWHLGRVSLVDQRDGYEPDEELRRHYQGIFTAELSGWSLTTSSTT